MPRMYNYALKQWRARPDIRFEVYVIRYLLTLYYKLLFKNTSHSEIAFFHVFSLSI